MKKFTIAILSLILLLSSMAFIGCGGGDDGAGVGHEHSYEKLKYDAQNHWYECSCAEKSGVEAHKGGTATETSKAVCEVCNQEYGDVLAPGHTHTFNKQVVADKFKKSSATCKGKAVYYLSCECGEKGSQTFESGAIGTHNYVGGVCEYCNNPEVEAQIGPMTKTQWQTALLAVATNGIKNGKLTVGPIENPGEYTIYEIDGNVVRQRVYDNDTLSLEVYCQKDGDNYYIFQEMEGTWYRVADESGAFEQVQMLMSTGAAFYDSYNGFTYNESTGSYVANNLLVQGNVFESVQITFANGELAGLKIVDYDEDKEQTHTGFKQEITNVGTTNLTLPEKYETID